MGDLTRGVVEIVMAIIGLAILGLIIGRSQQTAQVVSTAGNTLSQLIGTATLQNSGFSGMYGMPTFSNGLIA